MFEELGGDISLFLKESNNDERENSLSFLLTQDPRSVEIINEQSGTYLIKGGMSQFTVYKGQSDFDLSCRFAGLRIEQVNNLLGELDQEILTSIVESLVVQHRKLAEAPRIDPTRDIRILPGAPVWKSNFREQLQKKLKFLNHLDLRDLSLDGACLKGKELVGCLLDGTNLTQADCSGADMRECNFGEADLSSAVFLGTNLKGADLSKANLSRTRLFNYNHSYISRVIKIPFLERMIPQVVDFAVCDQSTRFLDIKWDDPRYIPTNEEVKAQRARFEGWSRDDFNVLTASGGPFHLGTLQRAALNRLANIILRPSTDPSAKAAEFLPDIVLNANEVLKSLPTLRGNVELASLPVIKGTHSNADLTDQGKFALSGGFIEDALLVNAKMTGQNLEGAVISNSDLSGANLQRVNLRGATLVNVDLTGADLRGADLTETKFVNCKLNGVKLDGVRMIDCQMQQCTMENVTITGGVIDGLILCQSFFQNISFSGDPEGSGLIVGGIGLYDSIVMGAQFSRNTTVDEIELSGSLFVGSGPGILKAENCIVGQGSEWRDRVVQTGSDAVLGQVLSEFKLEPYRIAGKGQAPNRAPDETNPTSILVTEVLWTKGGLLGEVPVLDHLLRLEIGYQGRIPLTGTGGSNKRILTMTRS
jgi:uncharacterized protein YjbI with pentapeptide repeats